MSHRSFLDFQQNQPLRIELFQHYLLPTARWLLGPDQDAYLLPQRGNSSWECALSIWFLLDIREELQTLDLEGDLQLRIRAKTKATVDWILDQGVVNANTINWDGVTWDTAVCIRSLVRAVREFPSAFSDADKDRVLSNSAKGIRWLLARFKTWESEVIYPYGPSDVAQILITLLYLHQMGEVECSEIYSEFSEGGLDSLTEEIVAYLLAAADDIEVQLYSTVETMPFWGDFFQSAEVVDALADLLLALDRGKLSLNSSVTENCEASVVACLRHLEARQIDGRWGPHADTCRALYAYLRGSRAVRRIRTEDHCVMKALRWMCDEKQTFSDGSFLHTTFITVFYALALWEAYASWELADRTVLEVYDYALWSAPTRATPERQRRLELELKIQRVRAEAEAQNNASNLLVKRARLQVDMVVGAFIFLSTALLGGFGGVLLGILEVDLNSNRSIGDFLAYGSIVATLAIACTGAVLGIRQLLRRNQ